MTRVISLMLECSIQSLHLRKNLMSKIAVILLNSKKTKWVSRLEKLLARMSVQHPEYSEMLE